MTSNTPHIFLHTARSFPLQSDFYITRLYDVRARRYRLIVILTEETWHDLNGSVTEAALDEAANFFPAAVQVSFEQQRWVVVTFEVWTTKLNQRQREEQKDE